MASVPVAGKRLFCAGFRLQPKIQRMVKAIPDTKRHLSFYAPVVGLEGQRGGALTHYF